MTTWDDYHDLIYTLIDETNDNYFDNLMDLNYLSTNISFLKISIVKRVSSNIW